MSSNIPDGYYFTQKHEWAKKEGDLLLIGISDYAQDSLGDIVFVDAPEAGTELGAGDSFGSIESVKAVEDLYAPVNGTVAESNAALQDAPESINKDPYSNWIIKLKDFDAAGLDDLMDAAAYGDYLGSLD